MRSLTCTLLVSLLMGCAVPAGGPVAVAPEALPQPGTGTLRQDEVSIALRSGDLQIKVTPLSESVTLTTAPDTYRRLSGLADRFRSEATQRSGSDHPELFLVSFYSESPDVPFVPEELQLISQNARLHPTAILPITPGWGQRRVAQRETEMAVYVFGAEVNLESTLVVAYGLVESSAWDVVLPRVRAERARARARGGTP